jgi:Putative zinc-finger
MRECEKEELQDALPGYAAGRLAGAERARVEEHVAGCADCAATVEMLRVAHQVMTQDAPPIDVSRIVATLPAPPQAVGRPVLVLSTAEAGDRAVPPAAQRPRRSSGYRPMWTGWRIAAVVSTIAVGGLSVTVMRDLRAGHGGPVTVAAVVATPVAATSVAGNGSPHDGDTENMASADAGLSVGGGLSDLSEGEMEGLLKDLDGIEASPSVEPDAAAPALHGAVVQ